MLVKKKMTLILNLKYEKKNYNLLQINEDRITTLIKETLNFFKNF